MEYSRQLAWEFDDARAKIEEVREGLAEAQRMLDNIGAFQPADWDLDDSRRKLRHISKGITEVQRAVDKALTTLSNMEK